MRPILGTISRRIDLGSRCCHVCLDNLAELSCSLYMNEMLQHITGHLRLVTFGWWGFHVTSRRLARREKRQPNFDLCEVTRNIEKKSQDKLVGRESFQRLEGACENSAYGCHGELRRLWRGFQCEISCTFDWAVHSSVYREKDKVVRDCTPPAAGEALLEIACRRRLSGQVCMSIYFLKNGTSHQRTRGEAEIGEKAYSLRRNSPPADVLCRWGV